MFLYKSIGIIKVAIFIIVLFNDYNCLFHDSNINEIKDNYTNSHAF